MKGLRDSRLRPGRNTTRFLRGAGVAGALVTGLTIGVCLPAPGYALQDAPPDPASVEEGSAEEAPAGDSSSVKKPDRRLYLGMWTFHFRWQESGIKRNPVLAFSWNGIFVGTFVNTYEDRSFTAGYQGEILTAQLGEVRLGLGYRAGLLSGYDERLHPFAGRSPVFPLGQARIAADTRWGGFEVTYAGIIATGAAYLRF